MDVLGWLRELGLEQYEAIFRENDIDASVLSSLTNEDLKEIGVASLGHRRKLLGAIAVLQDEEAGAAAGGRTVVVASEGERRQLTLMFCDLVGSTPLASRFDPEDLSEIIRTYHRTVADAIGRFDGYVAKYMGDGVLTYFGYPQAHEDDAERAVRAGLAVIEAVARLELPERLAVRIGVATGVVVVGELIGEGAAQERGVVGETPNLAARLQAVAELNSLVVADTTRRQIGALFEVEDLGTQRLAGFADPQHAWRVVAESGVVSRFEALRSGTAALVGREEELNQLLAAWQQAKTGAGRVVLISGEPGIGKSRLVAELAQRVEPEPHIRLRYFCSPYHQDSALYPFISQLEHAGNFARDDTADQKRAKLNALLGPAAASPDEVELIAELLSLPNSVAALNLTPQRRRQRLLEALVHQLEGLASGRPVLMVFEDAHWSDASSRELLGLTIDRLKNLPVALLVTFRPEFVSPWGERPYLSALTLDRLSGSEGTRLVENLAGTETASRDSWRCRLALANGREPRPLLAPLLPVQSASPSSQNLPQNHGAVFRAACDQIERRTIQISCSSIQRVRPVGPPVNTRCEARWGAQTGAAARTAHRGRFANAMACRSMSSSRGTTRCKGTGWRVCASPSSRITAIRAPSETETT